MDASQYKDYVLVLLFIKYISDKYDGVEFAPITVPKGSSFKDLVALKGKTTIGDDINKKIIQKIEEANPVLGKIAVDFNDPTKLGSDKDMVKRLSNLVAIFENSALDFSQNRADGDDILGDAYEYLMRHFATESGKSKGQFYTPAEVSRIIAKTIGISKTKNNTPTVYDPACGSGSLLLKVGDETEKNVTLYGQEMDNATAALARMNMILHNNPVSVIERENTLSTPLFKDGDQLKTFDFVIANPPFSYKSWSNGINDPDTYNRFEGFGTPPTKNGDYAFLLHIIKSIKPNGKGACILPHGVLFRGNTESDIRTNIIKKGYIKGIIGLPANLFYGTGIPACIIIIDKEESQDKKGIFMIDASKGFMKDGSKNRLREQDIRKIIDVWKKQQEIEKFSHFASNKEIKKHEYNLNLPRYIDTSEPEDIQNIEAHLKGGIPKHDIDLLEDYWAICPSLRRSLFKNSTRSGFFDIAISSDNIRSTILEHNEFLTFRKSVQVTLDNWRKTKTTYLKGLDKTTHPKSVIKLLSDSLLKSYQRIKLINKYDIYQHLMTYWEETMQDDVYVIAADGWKAGNEVIRLQKENKKGNKKEIAGLVGLEGRIIPISLIVKTYFAQEQSHLDNLRTELDQTTSKMEEMKEEYTGENENKPLEDALNDAGNVTKASMNKQIKELTGKPDFIDDLKILQDYADLMATETETKKKIKELEKDIEQKITAKYPTLSVEDIKKLVVERKWMDTLEKNIISEVDRLSQTLAGRVKELADRYDQTLPEIVKNTEELTKKVNQHLTKMGFKL